MGFNSEGAPEGAPEGLLHFPLDFAEASIMYSILYERQKCLPSREELLDEIARRELYPTTRHVIPQALDYLEIIQKDMREYLVNYAGEKSVRELEDRVLKTIAIMRKG